MRFFKLIDDGTRFADSFLGRWVVAYVTNRGYVGYRYFFTRSDARSFIRKGRKARSFHPTAR